MARLKTNEEVVSKLKKIKELGFVKTHRSGNTGIGKTLEDLLEVTENNLPGPDYKEFELKSARKNASSMLTLFTKSPLPPKANSILLQEFGYSSKKGNGKKELHTTLKATGVNHLKGKPGLKIEVDAEKIMLMSSEGKNLGYWDKNTLSKRFNVKYPGLLYVKAESRGTGLKEEFWFNEAWFLWDFSFENFVSLLEKDVILVDIRIGQYSNGKPHDHGTGFRVMPDKMDQCFKHREQIM